MKHWAKLLKRTEDDRSRSRSIPRPLDVNICTPHKVNYSLEKLIDDCINEDAVIFLIQDYEKNV